MKLRMIFVMVFVLPALFIQGEGMRQIFNKQAFYDTMASGNLAGIDAELINVGVSSIVEKEAYEGALLMRKAGLMTRPADKLKSFKAGRVKLETSLMKDSSNGEYHFLRLTIQEHAPGIVKYHSELKKDSQIIHNTFKNLSPIVQKAIIDYSKNSKILRPEEF
jgi:hypothetical protein